LGTKGADTVSPLGFFGHFAAATSRTMQCSKWRSARQPALEGNPGAEEGTLK
jgi:hypothetical protein